MTQDELQELVNQANEEYGWGVNYFDIEKFAYLVAAKEREACAKIADEWSVGYPHPSTIIATAIRARGELVC